MQVPETRDLEAVEIENQQLRQGLTAVVALALSFLPHDVIDREDCLSSLVVEPDIVADRVAHR